MTRDMNLIREILLWTEAKPDPFKLSMPGMDGVSQDVVAYHVWLLHDRGLLEAKDLSGAGGDRFISPIQLTWEGHDFLDAIRKDSVWAKLKAKIAEKGGNMPFDVMKELATAMARDYFTS